MISHGRGSSRPTPQRAASCSGRTYELLASYWPNAPEDEEAVAGPLNTLPKYVASRTLSEPLEWSGSSLLGDDIAKAVAVLKQEDGRDLHVVGSSELMQTLVEHDLVDELRLMIDPVVGGGKRVFRDDGVLRSLRLVEGQTTTTGAFLATYAMKEK
jgi:dihydrofolate reductase